MICLKKSLLNYCLCLMAFVFAFFFKPNATYAQTSDLPEFNVATTFIVVDKDIKDGDIVTHNDKDALVRTQKPEDSKIFGVVNESATMVYHTMPGGSPILRAGDGYLNVTEINGPIKKGDGITASTVPGKGQKAPSTSSYLVAVADEDLTTKNGSKTSINGKQVLSGQIKVKLSIGSSTLPINQRGSLFGVLDQLGLSLLRSVQRVEGTAQFFRYMVAGFVAILSIFIGFSSFGRNVTKGIESIGRNPLARISIQSMIVVNIVLVGVVSLGGIVLALIILRL